MTRSASFPAAPSIPASRPSITSILRSTRSMPSARPARPISRARPTRAGGSSPTIMMMGPISGASLERPALQALLADVRARKIDIVVVYKVDRLTRSLADFAKLIELFDAHAVSFVSVTQSFNTSSSMGRLTLNVLLSFAQFERELIGERVRDKIAASKRKGFGSAARSRSAMRRSTRRSWWWRPRPRRCARSLNAIWSLARSARWPRTSTAGASAASPANSRMGAPSAGARSGSGRWPTCG